MTREEAINEIKSWAIPSEKGREVLETLIPELKESEDERIRKAIVGLIEELQRSDKNFAGVELTDMLAYLEKQKEQEFTHHEVDESLAEAVTHQMEDDGDVDDFVRRGIDDIALKYAELGAKWQKEQKPISQEDFDTAKHEALWGEQKPAEWSGEDEKMLRTIISDGSRGVELNSKQISWLKSLRPSWKPSEEQMKALEDAFRKDGSDEYRKTINSLYQDLKKL